LIPPPVLDPLQTIPLSPRYGRNAHLSGPSAETGRQGLAFGLVWLLAWLRTLRSEAGVEVSSGPVLVLAAMRVKSKVLAPIKGKR
jgi:hypothetical protein